MLHDVLAKKFDLTGLNDIFTIARVKNAGLKDNESIISKINSTDNICVKVNGHDFLDLDNRCVSSTYKLIDYNRFDKIIFLRRKDFTAALLSYGYMDRTRPETWHKKKGQELDLRKYSIPESKITFLSRGYYVYHILTNYILTNYTGSIYKYEYDSVEDDAAEDFTLFPNDFDIATEANNIDYASLLANKEILQQIYEQHLKVMAAEPTDEIFWSDLTK
jgi:hypothetical protein